MYPQAPVPSPQPGMPPQAMAPVAPSVPKIDDTPIPMTSDELAAWWKEVDLAIAARGQREKRWDDLLRAYLPADDPEAINSNTHFRNTEQKKDSIYYRDPELILTPLEPLKDVTPGPDGQQHSAEDVVFIKQAVLNKLLGRDGVDLKWLSDEVLFEILQVSGLGPTKICYEADFETVMGTEVPVYEEWSWRKFSSKKLLIPAHWRSTRYDDAPWIGWQGVKPLAVAIREKLVPPDFEPNAQRDTHVFDATKTAAIEASGTDLVEFVEIFYRPALRDASVSHRQLQRRLVLVKGMDQPAKHVRSPYQTLGPDAKLTADSMIGYPIHVFTLRDLSDSAYVPSDAAMTDPLVRQINTWAAQDIKLRDANIPRFLHAAKLTEALKKLASGDVGEGAEVEDSVLMQGIEKLIAQLPHIERAQSDVEGRAQLQALINQTLALGPNQGGSVNQKVLSATEISTAQATSNVRLAAEQDRFLSQILAGVRKFDSLVQRFATETDYITWVGRDGQKRMAAWNQQVIAGRFAYDAKPDSQLKIDEAQKRQMDIQVVNLMANAPEANRMEMLRDLARDFGKDPAKWVHQPPPKQPDQPKMQLSLKPEDFIGPQAPIAAEFMRIAGTPISPQALQAAGGFATLWAQMQQAAQAATQPQTEHGGPLEGSGGFSPVSKHTGDLTGEPPGRSPLQ